MKYSMSSKIRVCSLAQVCTTYCRNLTRFNECSSHDSVAKYLFIACCQVHYREYCTSRFGRVIDYPLLPDVASESFAQERCKRLWSIVYPKEPFDIMESLCKLPGSFATSSQVFPIEEFNGLELEELVSAVARQSSFYYQVGPPSLISPLNKILLFSQENLRTRFPCCDSRDPPARH